MVQLLITVFSIILTALLIMVGITYAPWWYRTADATEELTKSSLHVMEQAYDVAARLNNGVVPLVTAEADGGFVSNFQPILKILPAAVPQFQWKYGEAYGLNYFCMESVGPTVNEGVVRGILRAKGVFSDSQVFVNTICGAQTNEFPDPRETGRLALTMFVAFVPGISK
jgi:hypothetical protein